MEATIIKLTPGKKAKLSTEKKALLKKLLDGPVMTEKQAKKYEKDHPWLKKIKD